MFNDCMEVQEHAGPGARLAFTEGGRKLHGQLDMTADGVPDRCPFSQMIDGARGANLDGYHHMIPRARKRTAPPLGPYDKADHDGTQQVLFRLSRLMGFTIVNETNFHDFENRRTGNCKGIPAGYTYLLQLACHDLVHTSVPIPDPNHITQPIKNLRATGLNLETIFGDGPGACPFAYVRKNKPNQMRWKLKLDRPSDDPVTGPKRLLEISQSGAPGATIEETTFDVMIADSRNDVFPVLSQLTALFHAFHNVVVDRLFQKYPGGFVAGEHGENIPDIGICARVVTAHVFREIIKRDLLRRLLDRAVYTAYLDGARIDGFGHNAGSVPVEFALAVSRVGHAMVRPNYALNQKHLKDHLLSYELAHNQNHSVGFSPAGMTPNRSRFLVDWKLYFGEELEDNPRYNWSKRIGPHVAGFFLKGKHFKSPYTKPPYSDKAGLLFRDLLRAASAEVCSATDLIRHLKKQHVKHASLKKIIAKIDDAWVNQIAEENLNDLLAKPAYEFAEFEFSKADINKVCAHPPLLFFALAEARSEGQNNGQRLGPLTSILFAEVFFRALDQSPAIGSCDAEDAKEQTINWAAEVFGRRSAIPKSMPALLETVAKYDLQALQT